MAVSDAAIRDYLAANPNLTDAQVAADMNKYGVSNAQMASATGVPVEQVDARYAAAMAASNPTSGSNTLGNAATQVRSGGSSSALTPQIAQDLMYRSMTTGAPTAEFDRYGGYDAVRRMYDSNGGQYSLSAIPDAQRSAYAKTIADTGVGNLTLLADTKTPLNMSGLIAMNANGIGADAINRAVADYGVNGFVTSNQFNGLQDKYNTLNTNYGNMQQQLQALQASYAALQRRGTGGTTAGSGGVVSGSGTTVDGSSSNANTGMDTMMGVVYGPDGTMYSSPAAARAAGVFNYTRVRPTRTTNPATTPTADPYVNASPMGFGGGLINRAVQGEPLSYFTNNAEVGLPNGVRPAF